MSSKVIMEVNEEEDENSCMDGLRGISTTLQSQLDQWTIVKDSSKMKKTKSKKKKVTLYAGPVYRDNK